MSTLWDDEEKQRRMDKDRGERERMLSRMTDKEIEEKYGVDKPEGVVIPGPLPHAQYCKCDWCRHNS